jgi:hypothetical protein
MLVGSILILSRFEGVKTIDDERVGIKDSLLETKRKVKSSKDISKEKTDVIKEVSEKKSQSKPDKSDSPKALDVKKEAKLKRIESKITESKERKSPKKRTLPKYTKRFLQIDSNSGRYKIVQNMYAITNSAKNRKKYPSAQVRSDHLLMSSKKKLKADSILQNKETNNYAIFNRVIKLKTQENKLKDLQKDLKKFMYKNLNELSMVNSVYELKFQTAKDALEAYELVRKSSYVIWSSIDVLEYERIN